MGNDSERQELIKEIANLDAEIGHFNLSTLDEIQQERIELLHKYNDTKDHAQRLLGALAELEQVSIDQLYKSLEIDFDEN